ncbi:hypothetical protein OC846_004988 [Tilletia horrida]|uniref:Uncharacterized protein n=1 Tax=Tilletia horrida TaxID=155126 RepID=A0AAN6JWF5_9BASI|nr:hypothetical protein OC846_004988 [Tilletia horrida]KAK0562702.1 hypothetical protein OC861_005191 [Tilletia horrida]
MDLIHGSFLSPRKATQDQRVFKYASRGFGLRFLPSYIEALPQMPLSERTSVDSDVDESSLPRDILHVTLREERARVGWWLAQKADNGYMWGPNSDPMIPMRQLNSRSTLSPELAERSSLSGWQHFVRHVALWEYAQMGYFAYALDEFDFIPQGYEDDPHCYQDGPHFSWHAGMGLAAIRRTAEDYSQQEEDRFRYNLKAFAIEYEAPPAGEAESGPDLENTSPHLAPRLPIQRAILASSLEEAFSKPLIAFVHLPRNFRLYAEAKLAQSPSRFADVTLPGAPCHMPAQAWFSAEQEARNRSDGEFVLSYWILPGSKDGRLTPYWQLVNREADEIHEIVHAFRRGHRTLNSTVSTRNKRTCWYVSRRLIRPTERSERDAFKVWACSRAQRYAGFYGNREDWEILDVPRSIVFGRFGITSEEALDGEDALVFGEEIEPDDESLINEPTTAAEWIEHVKDQDAPEWARHYRCRLPPIELLAEIRALAAAR